MLHQLMDTLPQQGAVRWIGLRPARREPIVAVQSVQATIEDGLVGDRFGGRAGSARQVTLIQWEHLQVIASLLGREGVEPSMLRRNIAVSGINLLALKGKPFRSGGAVLECTGVCAPCSLMETVFGAGGYNAIRGHGGVTARVVEAGDIRIGDAVAAMFEPA